MTFRKCLINNQMQGTVELHCLFEQITDGQPMNSAWLGCQSQSLVFQPPSYSSPWIPHGLL